MNKPYSLHNYCAINVFHEGANPYIVFLMSVQVNDTFVCPLSECSGGDSFDLEPGRSTVKTLTLKIPPHNVGHFVVKAAMSVGLSLCSLRVVRIGDGFPCLTPERITAEYTERTGEYTTESGYLDFGPLANVGRCRCKTKHKNTIM